MRILFVDDMVHRLWDFRRRLTAAGIEADLRYRKHVEEVVLPDDIVWADHIFLDHDMCVAGIDADCPKVARQDRLIWTVKEQSCACPDGRTLVDGIVTCCTPGKHIVVHSDNSEGLGLVMVQKLRAAGWSAASYPHSSWGNYDPKTLLWHWRLT